MTVPRKYGGMAGLALLAGRCHGQDVLPNPGAADLLLSLVPGGPIDTEPKFIQVVTDGRPGRGMSGFRKRIPPGRPQRPA